MTDPHASHDPRREAARPSWYGSEAGAGSSGTGSSAAGWPDAPTGDADRAAWDQAPSYAEQEEQTRPAYDQPYGYGQDATPSPPTATGRARPATASEPRCSPARPRASAARWRP
ncbi:hypothetical protein R0J91_00855 [Micrococcus sp. SIMBA_131]